MRKETQHLSASAATRCYLSNGSNYQNVLARAGNNQACGIREHAVRSCDFAFTVVSQETVFEDRDAERPAGGGDSAGE